MASRAGRPDGFVQVLVLVALATLAGIMTVALATSSQATRNARVLDHRTDAAFAAGSAIRLVLAAFADPLSDLETRLLASDAPVAVQVLGTEVALALEGEAGKINPVTADPDILEGYFADLSLSATDQSALDAVLKAARTSGDADAAIAALHTQLLPFVPAADLARDFTPLSASAGVDPAYASERVLNALPDLSRNGVATVLENRRADPSSVATLSRFFVAGPPVFTIVATRSWGDREATTIRVPVDFSSGRAVALDGFL